VLVAPLNRYFASQAVSRSGVLAALAWLIFGLVSTLAGFVKFGAPPWLMVISAWRSS
jgi:hypothetical protein